VAQTRYPLGQCPNCETPFSADEVTSPGESAGGYNYKYDVDTTREDITCPACGKSWRRLGGSEWIET
jgi:hypothetical protein